MSRTKKYDHIIYMKPLFPIEELDSYNSQKEIPFECEFCHKTYLVLTKYAKSYWKRNISKNRFCSQQCCNYAKITLTEVKCTNCDKSFLRTPSAIFNSGRKKSNNCFCSQSCSAIFSNTHKTKGTRKSKLECWLEIELPKKFPTLEFLFNQKQAINSELDIYLPTLKIAFEINGITHYKPIYGERKFHQIKENDALKKQSCLKNGIQLFIIDVSSHANVKESTCLPYLAEIILIVEAGLSANIINVCG